MTVTERRNKMTTSEMKEHVVKFHKSITEALKRPAKVPTKPVIDLDKDYDSITKESIGLFIRKSRSSKLSDSQIVEQLLISCDKKNNYTPIGTANILFYGQVNSKDIPIDVTSLKSYGLVNSK